MKRITFKAGPLKGKTYDMPPTTTRHNVTDGHYDIDGDTTKWRAKRKTEIATDWSETNEKPQSND